MPCSTLYAQFLEELPCCALLGFSSSTTATPLLFLYIGEVLSWVPFANRGHSQHIIICRIWGCHSGDYEDDTVYKIVLSAGTVERVFLAQWRGFCKHLVSKFLQVSGKELEIMIKIRLTKWTFYVVKCIYLRLLSRNEQRICEIYRWTFSVRWT
jgi:hypothetical protein